MHLVVDQVDIDREPVRPLHIGDVVRPDP